ncbi:hypothetical protein B0J11DRAFT_593009 [Dendryphion nanum]|uniref:Uncharacterized protein n=1 Tax=Dendryphion nanum TaxID=256645 RepID=A0A9P9IEZ1_9PLEO|nr:hypothetical protein B0J11DRAFT_593009 [Dendryphion nanum]
MAYQQQPQQYDNYQQQPRQRQQQQPQQQPQQQYYEEDYSPPQQQNGRQPARYNDQYNEQHNNDQYYDYGYDQGQYEQWDNGYHNQPQQDRNERAPPRQQQQQGTYDDMNNYVEQPRQARRPPPQQEQYAQDQVYDDRMYEQPQGRDPRGRPPPQQLQQPQQGAMHRGESQRDRPSNLPSQGRGGLRPPGLGRAALSPVSPQGFSQDNPFPSFPSTKPKPRPKAGSMDEAMSLMSIGQEGQPQQQHGRGRGPQQGRGRGGPMGPPPSQNRGLPSGRGGAYPPNPRQDSGHFEGDGRGQQPPHNRGYPTQRPPQMNLEGARGLPLRQHNPVSPTQQSFTNPGMQRSVTMPQKLTGAGNARTSHEGQQWAEPGRPAGQRGPEPPANVPPRPSTASGTNSNNYNHHQQFEEPPPPVPQVRTQAQPYQQHPQLQDEANGVLEDVYDDYYGDTTVADRKSTATSIDMPNFDAIPEAEPNSRHRRGFSIEGHLAPMGGAGAQGQPPATSHNDPAYAQQEPFQQQESRSRSQPDLHEQRSQGNGAFEMAAIPNGLPAGPRGRGPPPRGMTTDAIPQRAPSHNDYGQNPRQDYDPRYQQQQHPPMFRGNSGESAYSEPGPQAMRNGSPMVPGNQIPRPGTAGPGPIPNRMPSDPVPRRPGTTQPGNPDALPSHPSPVRLGHMQQPPQQNRGPPQTGRPPPAPVRQYESDPGQNRQSNQSVGSSYQRPPSVQQHPVTHDELNRLRNTWKATPSDDKTGLQLVKRLVEAASILSDEGGTADNRTRNKNREKFILEALKTVKKLVQSGSPDAMFYYADCYGQGLLGLQVDTKEAFTLYQSAAKAGHAASAYRTAVCCEMGHEEGGGTKRDPLKAVQWYRRAAALGDTPALYKMGMILLKGLLGQQKNIGEAINMLKRAADNADPDNPHALHELGLLYSSDTNSERIIPDEQYAASLFKDAAALGYKFSQFKLGQAYEYGLMGLPIDARMSIAYYSKAAAQEEHQSELALSGWYLTGTQGILEQSDTEAYLWARKAACAEPPLPKALFAMGYFTEVGIGCPRSLEEAKRWYGRAASYKFPKAQERLEELKRGGSKVQMKRERLSRSNQKQHEQENCVVM